MFPITRELISSTSAIRQDKSQSSHIQHLMPKIIYDKQLIYSSSVIRLDKTQTSSQHVTPSKIFHDKEKLYEQLLNAKSQIHALTLENKQNRIKNENLEREAGKYTRIIEDLKNNVNINGNNQMDTLHIRLRRQIKDLQNDQEIQKNLFEKFKKEYKTSKIQELTHELEIYQQQVIQLRAKVDQLNKIDLQFLSIDQQKVDIEYQYQLKQDNIQLASIVKELQHDLNKKNVILFKIQYENTVIEQDKQLKLIAKDLFLKKKQIKEYLKEKDLQLFKKEKKFENLDNNLGGRFISQAESHGLREQNEQLKAQLEDHVIIIETLNKKIQQKQREIQEMEQNIKNIKVECQNKLDLGINEKRAQKNKYEELERKNMELNRQKSQAVTKKEQDVTTPQKPPGEPEFNYSDIAPIKEQVLMNYNLSQGKNKIQSRKRVAKVHDYDVTKIAKNIQFSLRIKQIHIDNAFEELIKCGNTDDKISIRDIVQRLYKSPFEMASQAESILIARYLVEQDSKNDNYYNYDESKRIEIKLLKPIFKNLLKKYVLYTNQEEEKLFTEVSEVYYILQTQKFLIKHKISLQSAIKLFAQKKKDFLAPLTCEFDDLIKSLEYCELEKKVNSKHLDYIVYKCYGDSQDANIIYYESMFNKFNGIFINKEKKQLQNQNSFTKESQVQQTTVFIKRLSILGSLFLRQESIDGGRKNSISPNKQMEKFFGNIIAEEKPDSAQQSEEDLDNIDEEKIAQELLDNQQFKYFIQRMQYMGNSSEKSSNLVPKKFDDPIYQIM